MQNNKLKEHQKNCGSQFCHIISDYDYVPLVPKTKGFYFDRELSQIEQIEFPASGALRVRKISTRSRSIVTRKYSGFKSNRMHRSESLYEHFAFKILDADPTVVSFSEQPVKIHYRLNDQSHVHVPDILVIRGNRRELWEVKADLNHEPTRVFERTELMKSLLPSKGFDYKLVCGRLLKERPELKNATFLLRFGRNSLTSEIIERARRLFVGQTTVKWKDFTISNDSRVNKAIKCSMILNGYVAIDPALNISDETLLAWRDEAPIAVGG